MRLFLFFFASIAIAQTADHPLHAVSDPGVVTTRQAITPAGVPTVFQGRVYGVAFGKTSSDLWVANASQLYRLDVKGNRIAEMIPTEGQPGMQGITFDPATNRPLIVVNTRRQIGLYAALKVRGSHPSPKISAKTSPAP